MKLETTDINNSLDNTDEVRLTYEILSKVERFNKSAYIIELVIYSVFLATLFAYFINSYEGESCYELAIGLNKYLHKTVIKTYKTEFENKQTDTSFLSSKFSTAYQHAIFQSPAYLLNSLIWYKEDSTVETSTSFVSDLIKKVFEIVHTTTNRSVGHKNFIVGDFILRQIRVEPQECYNQELKVDYPYLFVCYPKLEDGGISRSRKPVYFNAQNETINIWNFQDTSSPIVTTIRGTYGSEGYVIRFAPNNSFNYQLIDFLNTTKWIDQGTRALFLEFTFYNVNINKVSRITIFFEFLPSGGIETKITTHVQTVIRSNSYKYIIGHLFILAIFIIYYGVEEIYEIINFKLSYFRISWTPIDLALIVSASLIFFYDATMLFISTFNIDNIHHFRLFDRQAQSLFQELMQKNEKKFMWISVFSFFSIFKLLKYFQFYPSMRLLIRTLKKCFLNILEFAILFAIIFCAYAFTGYELFGHQNLDYSTRLFGAITLFRLLLGDYDYRKYQEANEAIGTLYFLSYIIIVYLLLLNMLVAIISEIYDSICNSNETFISIDFTTWYIKRNYRFFIELLTSKYKNKSYKQRMDSILYEIGGLIEDNSGINQEIVLDRLNQLKYKNQQSLKLIVKRYGFVLSNEDSKTRINEDKEKVQMTVWTQEELDSLLRNIQLERVSLEKYFDSCIRMSNEELEREIQEQNENQNYYNYHHSKRMTNVFHTFVLKKDFEKAHKLLENMKGVLCYEIREGLGNIKKKLANIGSI